MLTAAKVLPFFVMPLGVVVILLLLGLIRRRPAFAWAALGLLAVSSNPLVARGLIRTVEHGSQRVAARDAAHADAIVVLSAGRVLTPGSEVPEWSDPDRFFAGVELFQAGKAPLLVFTGAPISGKPGERLEGHLAMETARSMGVPPDRMTSTGLVNNTAEEAAAVARVLGARPSGGAARILLVTSAFHMPRARGLFEREGLGVVPFPVDFMHSAAPRSWLLNMLPTPDSLSQTHQALREIYGRVYYWLRARVS